MFRNSHPFFCGLTLAIAALGCGCSGTMEGEANPTEQASAPLNGTVTFPDSSCSATEQNKMVQAMAIAHSTLHDSRMLPCLKDADLVWTPGAYPEKVLQQMTEETPTFVKCEASGGAAAWACGGTTEGLCINKNVVVNATAANIAGIILHEVAHTKRYNHFNEYDRWTSATVNEQLNKCSTSISAGNTPAVANGVMRSAYKYETELAPVGADAGSLFWVRCAGGGFLHGWDIRADSTLNSLALRCRPAGATADTVSPTYGGGAGTLTTQACNSDELVVGITGRADTSLNAAGVVCQPKSSVAAGTTTGRVGKTALGGTLGLPVVRLCPGGMAVKGVLGRASIKIERLRLVCESVNSVANAAVYLNSALGDTTLPVWSDATVCTDHGAMTGFRASVAPLDSKVRMLSGICRPTETVMRAGTLIPDHVTVRPAAEAFLLAAIGTSYMTQDNYQRQEQECVAGSALVGLKAYSNNGFIAGLQGICAPIDTWSNLSVPAPVTQSLTVQGTTTVTAQETRCGRDQFLVGWQVGTNETGNPIDRDLRRIQLVCKSLKATQ